MRLLRSVFQLEADPPAAVGEVVGDNPEAAYLGGVGYMGPYAGAGIVIAHTDYPEGLRDILRQLAQVYYSTGLCQRHEFYRDWQAGCDYLVDLVLDCLHLLRSRAFGEQVVALALLALYMGVVWLRICSAVCIGGYSSLLCALSWISSIVLGL